MPSKRTSSGGSSPSIWVLGFCRQVLPPPKRAATTQPRNASSTRRHLGPRDRDKLDQYLTAVRETEVKLHKAEEWETRPKPKPPGPPPTDIENMADCIGRTRLLYDMVHLALASDSTRIITISQPQFNPAPPIEGVT